MHSNSDPGGGLPVMATEDVVGVRNTSPVVVVCGIAFVAGVGGGSGGGRAVVLATDGGGTTAVGPRHRHSLLVTSVSVV